MTDQTLVACHAPSLAQLLFETVCGVQSQKGFLIGTVEKQKFTVTTDDNEAREDSKTVIYIEHCVPITDDDFWNQSTRSVNCEQLQVFHGKIVGWYSFQNHNRSDKCTLKENLIHNCLLRDLKLKKPDVFVMALLSAAPRPGRSTHSFTQTFLRRSPGRAFEALRFKISSLSDKLTNSSGYLTGNSFPVAASFRALTRETRQESHVETLTDLFTKAIVRLSAMNEEVLELERARQEKERNVAFLRQRIHPPQELTDVFVPPVQEKEVLKEHLITYNPVKDYACGRVPIQQTIQDLTDELNPNDRLSTSAERETGNNENADNRKWNSPEPSTGLNRSSEEPLQLGRGRGRGRVGPTSPEYSWNSFQNMDSGVARNKTTQEDFDTKARAAAAVESYFGGKKAIPPANFYSTDTRKSVNIETRGNISPCDEARPELVDPSTPSTIVRRSFAETLALAKQSSEPPKKVAEPEQTGKESPNVFESESSMDS